jgi:AcrR family transcriptional regulator
MPPAPKTEGDRSEPTRFGGYLGARMPSESTPNATEPLYPGLLGRGRAIGPERVARHQKARLQGAMIEAVARDGYAGTTLSGLVALAGVSRTTFYQHFESKEDCFLSTFDVIVEELTTRVRRAYRGEADFREGLVAALGAFMDLVVEEPAVASFGTVEWLTLGGAGVAHGERASTAFEELVAQSFEHSPSGVEVDAITTRAIVGGIRGVVYRRLRAGEQAQLPGLVEQLVGWALGYQRDDSPAMQRAARAAGEEWLLPPRKPGAIDWTEPPDSRTSRAELSQRERIIRGAARVVVERGYGSLSIPAISAASGTSNQTFYENFASKREAFLAAFEALSEEAMRSTASAFEAAESRPERVGAGLRAMLTYIAGNELFARLAFFELPTAGPGALDRAELVLDAFTSYLAPGEPPGSAGTPVPPVIREALGSGVWAAIQYEIAHGRLASLPEKAPQFTRIALTPTGGRWPEPTIRREQSA